MKLYTRSGNAVYFQRGGTWYKAVRTPKGWRIVGKVYEHVIKKLKKLGRVVKRGKRKKR